MASNFGKPLLIRREKKWRTLKTPSWFANTKNYSLLQLLVFSEKRETEYKRWVTAFAWQREKKNVVNRKWAGSDLYIIFFVFCCSSRSCLLAISVFIASRQLKGPFTELTLKCAVIFDRLPIIAYDRHLSLFSSFLSYLHNHGSSAWPSFSQSQPADNLLLINFSF